MTIDNTAEQSHIQTLLEPNEYIPVGNPNRWGLLTLPPTRRVVEVMQPNVWVDEQTDNDNQDAYLASHGVPVEPKQNK